MFDLRPAQETRWDIVSLGEVLLRFDPGEDRIRSARSFRVYEGGGEYNVARNLAQAFEKRAAIVTALADNAVGRLVEELMRQGGVDTSNVLWRETDGISGTSRNGLYFWERGFGPRASTGCSDRANTAVSRLKTGEIDWQSVFSHSGARIFHTGGVFTALSETTPDVAAEAMQAARHAGVLVSYDLNYRDSIWSTRGGRAAAEAVNERLLQYADIVFGISGFDASLSGYSEEAFRSAADRMLERFQDLRLLASPLRNIISASRHDVGGVCYAEGKVYASQSWHDVDVLDRVGSGDAFAAGILYGMLEGLPISDTIETAVASSVLAMATPGDSLSVSKKEIDSAVSSSSVAPVR